MAYDPGDPYHWRTIGAESGPIGFLKARESYCVAASARFLQENKPHKRGWSLHDKAGHIMALLIHSKGSLFPIFNGKQDVPFPDFIGPFLQKAGLHAVQGIRRDAELLEGALALLGILPAEQINYDLMTLDREPNPPGFKMGPQGLILRAPLPSDLPELFPLQAAYEQEEVLPRGAVFNPAACRLSLEYIMAHAQILIAELGGRILGKINTNGASFSRYQIGGVYVYPEYRRLGIASRMIAVFTQNIRAQGRGITLFVKKKNPAARRVYHRIGFQVLEDYRISYY